MPFLCKCIFRFSRLFIIQAQAQSPSALLNPQRFYSGFYQCPRHFSSSTVRWEKDNVPSAFSKYEKFSEETAPVILDVEEEREKMLTEEIVYDEFKGINLERGVTGVFDITELVELLRNEKAEDIFVVKIPPKYNYADHMVIVNGRSTRHMLAMCDFVRKVYKKKRHAKDPIPLLEGRDSNVWMALDLGNICLHVFSKAGRKIYDLETLWSVGKEYDSLLQLQTLPSDKLITDYAKILASLSPKT